MTVSGKALLRRIDVEIAPLVRRRQVMFVAALLAILGAVRVFASCSAGGLWRDEAHSVNLATAPASDLFVAVTNNESFPAGWQLLLRTWVHILGSSDLSVRMMGLIIGLSVVPAMWWSTRQLNLSFPWWSMLLLGLDPTLIRFGGEVRGYSLGLVTYLVLAGMTWKTFLQATAWRWVGLMVVSLLAVQTSYTNCFMLVALFAGSSMAALVHRRWKTCAGFIAVGLTCAVTMLPYALYVMPKLSEPVRLIQANATFQTRFWIFGQAFLEGGIVRTAVWSILGGIGLKELVRRIAPDSGVQSVQTIEERDIAIFTLTNGITGTAGFWFYMNYLGVITQTWYYLPYLTLMALTVDWSIQLWQRRTPQFMTPLFLVMTLALPFICAQTILAARFRLTTMDLAADELTRQADSHDLVLVTPWYMGISFDRYYQGSAPWSSYPDVDHRRQHDGYRELFYRVMRQPPKEAVQTELERIDRTLRNGGTVWWVGHKFDLPPDGQPLQLTAAPDPSHGWKEVAFTTAWHHLALVRMQKLGATLNVHRITTPYQVHANEDPLIFRFRLKSPDTKAPPLAEKSHAQSESSGY